ncbi:MAG: NADH-quinone oxidoreductase subunit A, partial [Bacteroidaceae bacterium]|nr:NADH-quinone oxidoreductase subunit A [Bacteroidaceae bacterium]
VILFPWATIVHEMGVDALLGITILHFIIELGLAYAWRKKALEWK